MRANVFLLILEMEAERQSILETIDFWLMLEDEEDFKEHACGCKTPLAEGNMVEKGCLCDSHDTTVENEVKRRLNFKDRWGSDIFSG